MAQVLGLWGRPGRIILLTLMLVVLAYGAVGAQSSATSISVEEVIQRALAHDVAAQIAQLNLENARITYQRNMAVNLLSGSEYNRRSAESGLRTAEITYANRKADVAMNAVNQYFSLLSRELGVEISKAQVEVARINLDSTRRRANLGTASRLDVLDAEVDLGSVEMSLTQAVNNLAAAQETLANILGMQAAELPGLDPEPALPDFPIDAIDLEEAIQRALAHSSSLIGAQTSLELAQMEREQALAEGVALLDQKAAELKVRVAELELEQAERSVRLAVIAAYQDLVRAKEAMDVEEIQLTLARERHKLVQQQFEVGLRTQSESIGADVTLLQARQRELTARNNYYNAVLAFQKVLGAPIGEAVNEN